MALAAADVGVKVAASGARATGQDTHAAGDKWERALQDGLKRHVLTSIIGEYAGHRTGRAKLPFPGQRGGG